MRITSEGLDEALMAFTVVGWIVVLTLLVVAP